MSMATTARPSTSLAERTAPTLRPATSTYCPGRICSADVNAARSVCSCSLPRTVRNAATAPATSASTARRLPTEGDPSSRTPEDGGQGAADDVDEDEVDHHRARGRRTDALGPPTRPPAVVEADERDR